MRRATQLLAGVAVLVALAAWTATAQAGHPGPDMAVTLVGHHGGHHGGYHGWAQPPVVVYPAPHHPPVVSYYSPYYVVPRPYYPVYAAPYPGGAVHYEGRHWGITLGF